MDILFILIVLVFLLNFDLLVLKQLNPSQFMAVFKGHDRRWILIFCFSVFLIYLQDLRPSEMFNFGRINFIFVMSGYLYKRYLFEKLNRQFPNPNLAQAESLRHSEILPAVGIVLFWILSVLIFSLLLPFLLNFYPPLDSDLGEIILTAFFSSVLMVWLIFRACGSRTKFLERTALKVRGSSGVKVFLVPVLIGICMAVFSSLVIFSRVDPPSTPLNEILKATDSPSLIGIFIALAVLLAPLCEEIIFRGYYFDVLRRFKGQTFAFYFIALTFSFLHVGQYWNDWTAIAVVTFLGFILTFLRIWTGSTVASTVTHYVYNGLVTFIPVLMLIFSNPAYFKFQSLYDELDTKTKVELLKESIRQKPRFVEAYNDLAWLYAQEEKHLDEALILIEKALKSFPKKTAYLDTKAEILYKMGRVEEAIAIEERLVKLNPVDKQFKQQLQKFRAFLENFHSPEVPSLKMIAPRI